MLKLVGVGVGLSGLLAACGAEEEAATMAPTATTATGTATQPATPDATTGTPTEVTSSSSSGRDSAEAVRIGVLLPLTGVYATPGQQVQSGLELALESVGYSAGGRPSEVIIEDDANNPDQGLTKVRQLVERDRVHVLTGIVSSGVGQAIRDYVHEEHIPTIVANAGVQALTRDPSVRSPYIFRVSFANGQYVHPLLPWCYEHMNYRRVTTIAPDYAAGREKMEAVRRAFEEAGGEIVEEIYPPLDTNDFGPYLQRIEQSQPDAVWAFFAGGDALRFVTQYTEFGLKDYIPLTGDGSLVDELILEQLGDLAVGILHSHNYSPQYDSPENVAFVEAFESQYGFMPSQFSYQGYLAGKVLIEALEASQGAVEDTDTFLQALAAVDFTGPMGRVRFHPESQGVTNTVLILQVDRLENGELGDVILDVLPDIDDLAF